MSEANLQILCEQGQLELMETRYLDAAKTLADAEALAWQSGSFDTLSRLYLPLQEARRQIRQRCGDGGVHMRLFPQTATLAVDAQQILDRYPDGQFLTGGWGSVTPAMELRRLVELEHRYVETFLAATYPIQNSDPVVVIVPLAESTLPTAEPRSLGQLRSLLPPHCLVFNPPALPPDAKTGTTETFAAVMAVWEQLHLPYLTAADRETDPIHRMQAYRLTLRVDPACELAHQYLADVARGLAREKPTRAVAR